MPQAIHAEVGLINNTQVPKEQCKVYSTQKSNKERKKKDHI